jgi:diguanylate cyclase (GGDEF)-like protein/PAS domain S-box-containing protein
MKRVHRRLTIVLAVAGLSGALLAVQSAVAWKVLSNAFAALEQTQAERAIDEALEALEHDLGQLATHVHDYAAWDDAYEFVVTRDERFVRSNLTAETLDNLNLDFMLMSDAGGQDIVSLQRDRHHGSAVIQAGDPQILRTVRSKLPWVLAHFDADIPALSRIVQTRSGPLALAAYPILPTNGQGTPHGALVFGRFVDHTAISRVQTISHLPLDIYLRTDPKALVPDRAQTLWSTAGSSRERLLVYNQDSSLSGFASLRDADARPVAIIGTSIPRNLALFGRNTGRALVAVFGCVIGVFATVVTILLLHLQKIGEAHSTSQRRYRAVITQAQETMLLVDMRTRRILEANPAATTTLGFSSQELVEMDIDDLFYACDGDVLRPAHAHMDAEPDSDRVLIVRCKSKEFIDVEVTANALVIDEREVISLFLRDVSARKRAERKLADNQDRLAHLAHHDILTGLLNRLGLEERLPEALEAARRHNCSAAFLYIDLDHFKKVNELQGHACGDRLLQMAADRLRQQVSSDDLIARMGGDEFVVVALQLRAGSHAESIAARVHEGLALPFDIDGQHFKVTASIGVSVYPTHGSDYAVLLKNAGIALQESKESGRDTYSLFTEEMTRQVSERLALEMELGEAIQCGQLYLEYQPIVDPKTHLIGGLEALVRWRHPVRGRVPPLQFIGIAERTGQICDIGAFVIRETCRQIGEWQAGGAQPVPVAINVSSKQLEQHSFVQTLKSTLASAQISPSLLHIEITESVFMESSDARIEHLKELRQLGIEVSVDDFGTGYSNLAYLKHLPVDCLKIDRAFVRDLGSGGADEVIVRAIIRMADTLGLSTVAEGVETEEQARRLGDLGVTYLQGFYFSPPLPGAECGWLLQTMAPPVHERTCAREIARVTPRSPTGLRGRDRERARR